MEERLERLESQAALRDRTIEELSDALYEQQRRIDRLEKQLAALARKVGRLDEIIDRDEGPEGPPPHYGSVQRGGGWISRPASRHLRFIAFHDSS